jgi:hypothetical protein
VAREVENYRTFVRLCAELVAVNEQICDRRPARVVGAPTELAQLKKKLRTRFAKRWPRK